MLFSIAIAYVIFCWLATLPNVAAGALLGVLRLRARKSYWSGYVGGVHVALSSPVFCNFW